MNRTDLPKIVSSTHSRLKIPKKGGGQYISFEGRLVAFMSSDPEELRDRWTELRIFETTNGNFVGVSIGCSAIPNETDFMDCEVTATIDELSSFFTVQGKRTSLAYSLFDQVIDQLNDGVEYA